MNMFTQVAQHILAQHTPPDLSQAIIVLPNYHVAKPLAQALGQVAGGVLLLPQMLTLTDWSHSVVLEQAVVPNTRRVAALYQALREQKWFEDADLWGLAAELLALMDELSAHHVSLPDSCEDFTEQLTAAYQARTGSALQFEARVVHELWYAMHDADELDSQQAYQQRLARLAQLLDKPVYALLTSDLAMPEQRFFAACAVPVTFFDLREQAANLPQYQLLNQALAAPIPDLRLCAQQLPTQARLTLQLYAAHGLEHQAQQADGLIRRWLMQGKQMIAVVVLDRLVARRVRALLERAQIMVQDETGWTFATLSVSTVLMRWFDVIQHDAYYLDVLDLLKSPFLFADQPPAERKHAAFLFEQMVRNHNVTSHLPQYIEYAQGELVTALVRLRQAAQVLPKKASSLNDWLAGLQQSLEILGIQTGWSQDAAGQQLLQLFNQWREELRHNTTRFSFAEIRRWLAQQLDSNTFRDLSVDSPVLFTHLPATRWRRFDAVLLLGADAKHLPAPAQSGQWFNDAVRVSLGLPPSIQQQKNSRDDLLGLLIMNPDVAVSWQDNHNGEPNLLSPCFEMIRALHLLAFQHDLSASLPCLTQVQTQDDTAYSPIIAPQTVPTLIPQSITPYGYNSLMACPYQYYARHILQLNPLDEVREALGKRDYGVWVHRILQLFHQQYPVTLQRPRQLLEQALHDISQQVFTEALNHDYQAHAWLLRWRKHIPAYLDWQLENEQQGWVYQQAETTFNQPIDGALTLTGRIDRMDKRGEELRVLDYKTNDIDTLKRKLKLPGEDTQLACYSYACDASESAFVALDDDKVANIIPSEDIVQANAERLQQIFQQLRDAIPIPAQGLATVCQHCDMAGLCRREYVES